MIAERRSPPRRAFSSYGAGTWLVPPIRVERPEHIDLGSGVIVLENARIAVGDGARLRIGERTRFARGLTIECRVGIDIARDVLASDDVAIVDAMGPDPAPMAGPVRIEEGAYLGWGCTIGPGVTVGAHAYVGEGAVVLDDVPSYAVAYGNPATVIRRFDAVAGTWVDQP